VVLLDLFLPGQDGISVLAQIKRDRPVIRGAHAQLLAG